MIYNDIDFNTKTVLITGGAGFIGSSLAFYFQKNFPQSKIIVVDSFRSADVLSNGNLKSFGHFRNLVGFDGIVICGDINDPALIEQLRENYHFDYIYHQAAISDTTALEQDLVLKTNLNAYESLLRLAIAHGANMVYASSGATYGDAPGPQKVGCEAPNNVYGFSKLMMDKMSLSYIADNLEISIVGLRYFNVYGAGEFFKNKTASMILQLGHQILNGQAPRLFENSDAILRDFVYIKDIIGANILASSPKKSGIYNVGTGKARSFQDVADILQRLLHTDYPITYIENPYIGQYQFFTQADIASTQENLCYAPQFSLEDGIADYLPYIQKTFGWR